MNTRALIYGRLVGGSNAHFTGNAWRMHPADFNEASVLGGVPGTGFVDWPITYDELEPYYTKSTGNSASPASRDRSIRHDRSLIRCRRCPTSHPAC